MDLDKLDPVQNRACRDLHLQISTTVPECHTEPAEVRSSEFAEEQAEGRLI
jgi:hypothetical protein